MKSLFELALRSLKHRIFSTSLTVVSIALGFSLLISVEKTKRAAEEGFTQAISQTDLIVGARTGQLQLILYTVFNLGTATNNITWNSFEKYSKHQAVDWTIPYTLGDSHRGFRIVGTNLDFFKHYHFRGDKNIELAKGNNFDQLWDVVVGSEVAKSLNYDIGQAVTMSHGVTRGEGIQQHGDRPFKIVGILKPTGTPIDRALYISLEGFEALHIDWEQGAQPTQEHTTPQDQISKEKLKVATITAFFLRTKSRIETLKLQREINNESTEPLLAIIPGVVLSELWRGLSTIDKVLHLISWLVVLVSFCAMLISLTTILNERRREMAILRALGAQSKHIVFLMIFESGFLAAAGVVLGWCLTIVSIFFLGPWLEAEYGFVIQGPMINFMEICLSLVIILAGLGIGLYPALRAQRMSLKDGLSVRI
ncbi:MAG: FtsX-like permease family protein [Bdellovibrionota bacterium]